MQPWDNVRSMSLPRIRIGQLLVDAGLLSAEVLELALEHQKADGRRLGTLLVERGFVDETQLTQILSHQLSVPWVSLLHIEFSRKLLDLVPRATAECFCLVPIYVRHVRSQGDTLYVAMEDPTNDEALRACSSFAGLPVRAMIAPPSDVRAAIRAYYGGVPIATRRDPGEPTPPDSTSAIDRTRGRRTERVARSSPPGPGDEAAASPPSTPARAPTAARGASDPVSSPETPQSGRQPGPGHDDEPTLDHAVIEIPAPRGGRPARMVSLTLLDGTTISLPARRQTEADDPGGAPAPGHQDEVLTTRDLVAALRAVAHGADGRELLGGDLRWEALFAALLSLLLRKKLIADWELVDELKKI